MDERMPRLHIAHYCFKVTLPIAILLLTLKAYLLFCLETLPTSSPLFCGFLVKMALLTVPVTITLLAQKPGQEWSFGLNILKFVSLKVLVAVLFFLFRWNYFSSHIACLLYTPGCLLFSVDWQCLYKCVLCVSELQHFQIQTLDPN